MSWVEAYRISFGSRARGRRMPLIENWKNGDGKNSSGKDRSGSRNKVSTKVQTIPSKQLQIMLL